MENLLRFVVVFKVIKETDESHSYQEPPIDKDSSPH